MGCYNAAAREWRIIASERERGPLELGQFVRGAWPMARREAAKRGDHEAQCVGVCSDGVLGLCVHAVVNIGERKTKIDNRLENLD